MKIITHENLWWWGKSYTMIADDGKSMIELAIEDDEERKDKLIIISTNLNAKELRDRYGERVADRLRKLTTQVVFKGVSLRK